MADAHVLALQHLENSGQNFVANCGYGRGYSVREVIHAVEREIGHALDVRSGQRRAGDAPILVADTSRIRALLDWQPKLDDLCVMVRTALAWERKLMDETP